MSTILAIDLRKFKSVACIYQVADGTHRFQTLAITPAAVHNMVVSVGPQRVVIGGSGGGLVCEPTVVRPVAAGLRVTRSGYQAIPGLPYAGRSSGATPARRWRGWRGQAWPTSAGSTRRRG